MVACYLVDFKDLGRFFCLSGTKRGVISAKYKKVHLSFKIKIIGGETVSVIYIYICAQQTQIKFMCYVCAANTN